jgi:hypothetical protein
MAFIFSSDCALDQREFEFLAQKKEKRPHRPTLLERPRNSLKPDYEVSARDNRGSAGIETRSWVWETEV